MNDRELTTHAEAVLARMDQLMERCRQREEEAAALIARMRKTIEKAEAVMARFDQLQG